MKRRVPRPGGLSSCMVPTRASMRPARPASPGPFGSAPPTPSSRTARTRNCPRCSIEMSTTVGFACFAASPGPHRGCNRRRSRQDRGSRPFISARSLTGTGEPQGWASPRDATASGKDGGAKPAGDRPDVFQRFPEAFRDTGQFAFSVRRDRAGLMPRPGGRSDRDTPVAALGAPSAGGCPGRRAGRPGPQLECDRERGIRAGLVRRPVCRDGPGGIWSEPVQGATFALAGTRVNRRGKYAVRSENQRL